jgi:hypothetical protein
MTYGSAATYRCHAMLTRKGTVTLIQFVGLVRVAIWDIAVGLVIFFSDVRPRRAAP